MLCGCTALVWQLMKAYTLSILTRLAGTGHPIVDKQIVEWANDKVSYIGIFVALLLFFKSFSWSHLIGHIS